MLILVGVTINVALNGNLFGKAETATRETEEQAILEEMLSMMEITEDGKFNPEAIISKMEKKYTVEYIKPNATITGKLGTYNYIVSEAEIRIGSSKSDIDEDFEKYIMGADKTGRILTEVDEEGNPIGGIFNFSEFLDDPLTEDVNETETLGVELLTIGQNEDMTKGFIYAKYDNKAYKIVCDVTTYNTEKLEMIYEPKGTEGQTTADGWRILYDNGTTAEAVSPTAMGSLRLGYAEGTTDSDTKLAETIESYNNAIKAINDYCKNDLTGLPTNTGVRSVGGASETSSDSSNMYVSTNLETWNSAYNGVGKKGDILFEQDLVRMAYWGESSIGTKYWMASRCVSEYSTTVRFDVYNVGDEGLLGFGSSALWYVLNSGNAYCYVDSFGVRPVITIENL